MFKKLNLCSKRQFSIKVQTSITPIFVFFSICSEFDSGIGFQNKSQLNEHEGQFSASNDLIDTDDFLMPPSFENILRGLGVFPT